jgi:hypothetical protein
MQTDGKENQKALKNSSNYIYQFNYKRNLIVEVWGFGETRF